MKIFLYLVLLFSFISLFFCKKVTKTISFFELQEENWRYITKFGFERGHGKFQIRARLLQPLKNHKYPYEDFKILTSVFLDIEFPEALRRQKCDDKNLMSRYYSKITIPKNGDWSNTLSSSLGNNARPYVWYFIISDCDKEFEKFLEPNEHNIKIQFEYTIKNTDGSEFSIEDKYFLTPYIIITIICSFILIYNSRNLFSEYKSDLTINYPLVFVSLALFFQISSLIFESLHLWIYSRNGTGLFLFDLLSQVFYVASQFIFTVLLILLSWGWTINFMEFESMTIFMPFSILIGIIQIGFVFLSKASDDTYYKFHDYEDLAGYLIVFLRSGLFFYFLKGLYRTFLEANEKIRSFIVKLGIFGSIYILAFPVIIGINTIVAQYCRHQVIVIGSLVLQIFGILIITILFNKKKGNYYDISLQSTPLLPMGKKKKGKID